MSVSGPIAASARESAIPDEHAGVSLLARIGNTPLLHLNRVGSKFPNIEFCAKAEWFIPGGSVKDRPALSMIQAGLASGALKPGKTIIDATSGNTGIAYAMLGAAEKFPVTLCMPTNVSVERKQILSAYGANILYTDPGEGSDGAIRMARELAAKHPDLYFYADQYSNDANWLAHYHGTANEIWQQTEGRITHFAAMLGTSGTFVGTTRRLRELNPAIRCVSFQPDSGFHGLEGLKHMATAIVPRIYDSKLADEDIPVRTEDAQRLVKRLAREEGILAGVSSGAALWACMETARRLPAEERAVIVTVFPDSGEKYLTERFWSEA